MHRVNSGATSGRAWGFCSSSPHRVGLAAGTSGSTCGSSFSQRRASLRFFTRKTCLMFLSNARNSPRIPSPFFARQVHRSASLSRPCVHPIRKPAGRWVKRRSHRAPKFGFKLTGRLFQFNFRSGQRAFVRGLRTGPGRSILDLCLGPQSGGWRDAGWMPGGSWDDIASQ